MSRHSTLTKTRIHAGYWEGVLSHDGPAAPELIVSHQGEALAKAEITPLANQSGQSLVRVRIPPELLSDGVHSFVISDASGAKLAQFSILAGDVLDEDIRAELDLLRAELELLKQAFRRHCAQTS